MVDMASSSFIVNAFLALQVISYVCAIRYGHGCTSPTGGKGRCIRMETCTKLLVRRSHHKLHQICGDSRSTVCCPLFERIVTPPSSGDQKCMEYALNAHEKDLIIFRYSENLPAFTSFIVGGAQAAAKEFPHMAALGYLNEDGIQWLCGGSLISEQFVLTAAHCTSSNEVGELNHVRLGDLKLQSTSDDTQLQEFSVAEIFRHPDYAAPALYNDIALIHLDRPVQITDYVRPACLQTTYDIPDFDLIATGWGRTQFIGPKSDQLQKVSLEQFTSDICNQSYGSVPIRQLPYGIVGQTQICAGGINPQRDTCQGDSGGPLHIVDPYNPRLYYIIGITSFGKGCGTSNNPGVYTRVSHYVPWIKKIVWQH